MCLKAYLHLWKLSFPTRMTSKFRSRAIPGVWRTLRILPTNCPVLRVKLSRPWPSSVEVPVCIAGTHTGVISLASEGLDDLASSSTAELARLQNLPKNSGSQFGAMETGGRIVVSTLVNSFPQKNLDDKFEAAEMRRNKVLDIWIVQGALLRSIEDG